MEPLEWIAAVNGVIALIKYLRSEKAILDQNDVWTPEQRAQKSQVWNQLVHSHAWLTDDEGG
jgi:hypothetical protein